MKLTAPFVYFAQVLGARSVSFLRIMMARAQGGRIGSRVRIASGGCISQGSFLRGKLNLEIGARAVLDHGACIHLYGGSISLGKSVYIGPYSVIFAHGGVSVGDNSLIAMHCTILSSQHSCAETGRPMNQQPDRVLPTAVGEDVWIGAGSTIMGGVTIGDGSVIGAGSVVTKAIPAGVVAWGSPATVRRKR